MYIMHAFMLPQLGATIHTTAVVSSKLIYVSWCQLFYINIILYNDSYNCIHQ